MITRIVRSYWLLACIPEPSSCLASGVNPSRLMKRKSRLNASTVHGAGCCRLHATRCPKVVTGDESATPCHVFSVALTLNEFVILYRWNSCLARKSLLTCCLARWWCIYVMVGTFFAGSRRDRFLGTIHHCPTARSQRSRLTRPGIKKPQNTPLLSSSPSACLYGVSWLKVTCASARFLFCITSDARLGFLIC